MVVPRLAFAVLALLLVSTAAAEPAAAKFSLQREDLVATDSTLVVRLSIVTPKLPPHELSRLVFGWRPKFGTDTAVGLWEVAGKGKRVEVVIVAQVTGKTDSHPAMLILSTQQSSKAKANTFHTVTLDADVKIGEVLDIDIKPGEYPVGSGVPIAKLRGEPVYLSIEPQRE